MPARSQQQREFLNWRFGHDWVKEHHFDNKGKLPKKIHMLYGGPVPPEYRPDPLLTDPDPFFAGVDPSYTKPDPSYTKPQIMPPIMPPSMPPGPMPPIYGRPLIPRDKPMPMARPVPGGEPLPRQPMELNRVRPQRLQKGGEVVPRMHHQLRGHVLRSGMIPLWVHPKLAHHVMTKFPMHAVPHVMDED